MFEFSMSNVTAYLKFLTLLQRKCLHVSLLILNLLDVHLTQLLPFVKTLVLFHIA